MTPPFPWDRRELRCDEGTNFRSVIPIVERAIGVVLQATRDDSNPWWAPCGTAPCPPSCGHLGYGSSSLKHAEIERPGCRLRSRSSLRLVKDELSENECIPTDKGATRSSSISPNSIRSLANYPSSDILVISMRQIAQNRLGTSRMRSLAVAFVAILLLFGTTLQLTHFHTDNAPHPECAVCQGNHNVVRPVTVVTAAQTFVSVGRIVTPMERPWREHPFSYSHWNRPPADRTANR